MTDPGGKSALIVRPLARLFAAGAAELLTAGVWCDVEYAREEESYEFV